MTSVTKSAYAKKHGWSPAYVTKLIAQGRVILDDNNHVLVAESDLKIKQTAGARGDVADRNSAERKQKKSGKAAPLSDLKIPLDELPEGSRAKYKAMTMHFENQSQKLAMSLAQGIRFDLADVREEALGIGNTLRTAVERLIDTTAPRIAIAKTQEERARILQPEVAAMRKTLKNAYPRAFVRLARKKNG